MEEKEKMQQLESRITSRPKSPLFARFAESLLQQGETARAIELCEKGMEIYPEYTTGFLVAARCYNAAGRTADAERVLRYILKHHTRHSTALKFLDEIKNAKNDDVQVQAAHAKAFEEFAGKMKSALARSGDPSTLEEFLAADFGSEDGSIEELAESLKGAKMERPAIPPAPEPITRSPEEEPRPAANTAIASETLAEIYEKQGQYGEAIATYRELMEQKPSERKKYEQRIEMLQQLIESRTFGM